jgi:acetolactate synthase-1/2/3 large subunit
MLSQIAQAQQKPYRRMTCSKLNQPIDLAGVAQAVGAAYVAVPGNAAIAQAIAQARGLAARGQPGIVDVAVDYSKPRAVTVGTTQTSFRTFPLGQKLRIVRRMIRRKLFASV